MTVLSTSLGHIRIAVIGLLTAGCTHGSIEFPGGEDESGGGSSAEEEPLPENVCAPIVGPPSRCTTAPSDLVTCTQDYSLVHDGIWWVDDFEVQNCDAVEGSIKVWGIIEPDLSPLSCLERVTGDLKLDGAEILPENVDALSNLVSVGGAFEIQYTNGLKDLDGLWQLKEVGSLELLSVDVGNIDGLSSLSGAIPGDLVLALLFDVTNVDGLCGVTSVGGDVYLDDNYELVSIFGLSGLTGVGGDLYIVNNPKLPDLDMLSGLATIGGDIHIFGNDSLCQADALQWATERGTGVVDVRDNRGPCP